MAQVEIRNVSKFFDPGKPVLKDISFTVRDAEFVTLLGPSGCGKTTLLRIIAGLEQTIIGSVHIDGHDMTDVSPKNRDIAFVFQNYALYPHLSVEENIGMGLKLRHFPPDNIRKRVQETAKMLGLEPLLHRRPKALSGGQRQRVALARALVRHPKVFMLDEPLSNLDAVLRERTRSELKLLFKRVQGTVIYVTHDQVEAMTLSDLIVVINEGRIQQIGTPDEIYSKPANTFVAGFIGAPPMNILSKTEADNLELPLPASIKQLENFQWGIRPEDILVSLQKEEGYQKAAVVLAEPTGANVILSTQSRGVDLRATVTGTWNEKQTEVWIYCKPRSLHFFDDSTGRIIEK